MKSARVKRAQRRVFGAALLAASVAAPATAQEAVPETPPELKDFRLDTPPPREKAPETPPSVPAPQPQPKAETPRPEPRASRPAAETARPPAAEEAPAEQPEPEAAASLPEPVVETLPETATPVDTGPVEAAPEASDWLAELARFWPLFAALLALLAGWMGFRWLQGRQPGDALEGLAAEAAIAPAAKDIAAKAPRAAPLAPSGTLTASFDPADARLSLANLTITGCLRLRYDGPEALQSLRLRNQVISACEGQRAMIDAFHNDPNAGQIDTLGEAQPGEEIVLTLELKVPREALQAFDWRERRFIAPILLLNLSADDSSVVPCQINCLVGQEGNPESPRMRPLPIDRGPRHFAALRFQPLAA